MNANRTGAYVEDKISVLEINNVLFGVSILKSIEVIPKPYFTPVPNTEEFVVGVFNLRGEIYSLVDVSAILDMQPKKIMISDMVLILEGNGIILGILADRVHGVRNLNNYQIKPSQGIVAKKLKEFVTGIISEKSSDIFLLDVDRLFASREICTYF
jgi:purine-binding chemotaxis protein CheW